MTSKAAGLCGWQKKFRILDACCGAGMSAGALRRGFGVECIGVDSDVSAVAGARKNFPEIRFFARDIAASGFEDEWFDGAISECSLSVTEDINAVLLELFRVLKRGARLAVSDVYMVSGESCGGVFRKSDLESAWNGAGFRAEYWGDETPLLRGYAAERIFKVGRENFLLECGGISGERKASDFGYYLAVLRKP